MAVLRDHRTRAPARRSSPPPTPTTCKNVRSVPARTAGRTAVERTPPRARPGGARCSAPRSRHSLSPVLHRAAYAELGLDWVYERARAWREHGPAGVPRRARRDLAGSVADDAAQAGGGAAARRADRPGALRPAPRTPWSSTGGRRTGHNTDVPGASRPPCASATTGPVARAVVAGRRRDRRLRAARAGRPGVPARHAAGARPGPRGGDRRDRGAAPGASRGRGPAPRRAGRGPADVLVSTVPAAAQAADVLAVAGRGPGGVRRGLRPVADPAGAAAAAERPGARRPGWTSWSTRPCCRSS